MAHFEYTGLLQALLKTTQERKIDWLRENISKYQFYYIDDKKRKLLLDKYYASIDGSQIPCINMTSFNTNGKIIDEIVLCNTSPEKEEYSLLERLYSTVSDSFSEKEMNLASPILSEITESFQRLAAS